MLKSMKYEFLRSRVPLFIIVCIYGLLEILFLIGTAAKSEGIFIFTMIGLGILTFFCQFYILISGITSYSRELREKSGYLVFMTPVSTYRVIGAKLLMILAECIVFAVVFAGSVMLDLTLALHQYAGISWNDIVDGVTEFFMLPNREYVITFFASIGAALITILVFLYTVTTFAYLALSLSATVLQNKKGRGLLSFAIFIALMIVLSLIQNLLPGLSMDWDTPVKAFTDILPNIGVFAAASVGAFFGTALLLDKKISL